MTDANDAGTVVIRGERMLIWFANTDPISVKYYELGEYLESLPACAERTVAFRKLLESMDAARRAATEDERE